MERSNKSAAELLAEKGLSYRRDLTSGRDPMVYNLKTGEGYGRMHACEAIVFARSFDPAKDYSKDEIKALIRDAYLINGLGSQIINGGFKVMIIDPIASRL